MLKKTAKKNPANEREYLRLIYLYSENGDTTKAYQTALEWQSKFPKSTLVHLALYKFYLDQGNTKKRYGFNEKSIEFKQHRKRKQI